MQSKIDDYESELKAVNEEKKIIPERVDASSLERCMISLFEKDADGPVIFSR